jgi:hypothetical protein
MQQQERQRLIVSGRMILLRRVRSVAAMLSMGSGPAHDLGGTVVVCAFLAVLHVWCLLRWSLEAHTQLAYGQL